MTQAIEMEKPNYGKLKHVAYHYVVENGMTQKAAAMLLGVAENTMSEWAIEGNWRELRKMRQSASSTAAENLKQIISLLTDKRLELELRINEAVDANDKDLQLRLRKEANTISNDIAYQNKTLTELNKDRAKEVTLSQYVDVFDDIFSALNQYSPDIFEQTIEFQTAHLRRKSNELG